MHLEFRGPCGSGFHTPGTRARHVGLKADLLVVYLTRPLSGVRVFCSLCSDYELINRRNCFCNPCRSGFHTPGTRARHVGLKADLLVVYLPRPLSGVRVFCSLCSGYELINRRNCFCNPCRSGFSPMCRPEGRPTGRVFDPVAPAHPSALASCFTLPPASDPQGCGKCKRIAGSNPCPAVVRPRHTVHPVHKKTGPEGPVSFGVTKTISRRYRG